MSALFKQALLITNAPASTVQLGGTYSSVDRLSGQQIVRKVLDKLEIQKLLSQSARYAAIINEAPGI